MHNNQRALAHCWKRSYIQSNKLPFLEKDDAIKTILNYHSASVELGVDLPSALETRVQLCINSELSVH